ncbi:MAG: four helix bundle protein [Bacteroidia bacterium]
MKDYKNLIVWQKSHRLTLHIYELTKEFPSEEKFGLISQIRRSSSSIATNIAEGCGHDSKNQFARYLQISSGSANETEYLIVLSKDLGYIKADEYEKVVLLVTEVKKMLYSLLKKSTPIYN